MKNKLLTFILCFLVAVSSVSAVFAADAPAVAVGIAEGIAGELVNIDVELSGNTGFASLGIEIGYDSSALQLVNVVAGAGVGATFTPAQTYEANPYNMSWDSMSNVTYNGTLATLTFSIITSDAGTYPVTVDYYKGRDGNYTDGYDTNYDEGFNDINLGYKSGCINVIKTGTGSGGSGGESESDLPTVTVDLPLELGNNNGFTSLGVEIGYDTTALRLTNVTANSGVGGICTQAQDYQTNPYNIGWDNLSNITYNGTLATLTFEILTDKAGEYPVTVDYYKGRDGTYTDGYDTNYDENFDSINLQYVNGAVTVDAARGVDVKLNLDGGMYGAKFDSSDYNGYIIAALYSSDGKLITLKKCGADKAVQFTFEGVQDTAYVKLMWWGSMTNIRPLHKSQIITVS